MDKVNKLIEQNIGLVGAQLKKLHLSKDKDAYSEGLNALYKAIVTFDAEKDTKLSTYATTCIYNALAGYLRKQNSVILTNTCSYDAPLADSAYTLADTLVSPLTADSTILTSASVDTIEQQVYLTLNTVTHDRAKKILSIWIDSNYTMLYKEIAAQTGCSPSYVSNTIQVFRKNLKKRLKRIGIMEG